MTCPPDKARLKAWADWLENPGPGWETCDLKSRKTLEEIVAGFLLFGVLLLALVLL